MSAPTTTPRTRFLELLYRWKHVATWRMLAEIIKKRLDWRKANNACRRQRREGQEKQQRASEREEDKEAARYGQMIEEEYRIAWAEVAEMYQLLRSHFPHLFPLLGPEPSADFDPEKQAAAVERTLAAVLADEPATIAPPPADELPPVPRWDKAAQQLFLGADEVRRFVRNNARKQFMVLDAFEAADWKAEIDAPKCLLSVKDTIDSLNDGLADSRLRFGRTCGDTKLSWRLLPV